MQNGAAASLIKQGRCKTAMNASSSSGRSCKLKLEQCRGSLKRFYICAGKLKDVYHLKLY